MRRTRKLYVYILIANAIAMLLELLASRILSPYFGTGNAVWTAIIAIILLAGSIGNLIGGKIVHHDNAAARISMFHGFAALWTCFGNMASDDLMTVLRMLFPTSIGALISSSILFLFPSLVYGLATPIVTQWIRELPETNPQKQKITADGMIFATISIGSLMGTMLGGFLLIPAFGCKTLIIFVAVATFLLGFLLMPAEEGRSALYRNRSRLSYVIIGAFLLGTILMQTIPMHRKDEISIDTQYGRIMITDTEINGEQARLYRQSGAYSSGSFLRPELRNEVIFDYLGEYNKAYEWLPSAKATLMIGGAAYSFPKYFISHYDTGIMDVVEIDPEAERIARKYFFLDDLIRDYDTETTGRLNLITADGRIYIKDTDKEYDVILNDAFSGVLPVGTLATKEAAGEIKNKLSPNGIYLSNVLGTATGDRGKFLRTEIRTLQEVFTYVYVLPVNLDEGEELYRNHIVVASDWPIQCSDFIELDLSDAIVLTDDYCPVDDLVGNSFWE